MPDLTTLRSLRERVEKASRPDRELDKAISKAVLGEPSLTPLTGSIDAIRALIRWQFPNACITINEWADHADFGFSLLRHEDDYATAGGEAATVPLAGCLALLSALISIEERRVREGGEKADA